MNAKLMWAAFKCLSYECTTSTDFKQVALDIDVFWWPVFMLVRTNVLYVYLYVCNMHVHVYMCLCVHVFYVHVCVDA